VRDDVIGVKVIRKFGAALGADAVSEPMKALALAFVEVSGFGHFVIFSDKACIV
jgi:hypothetical protein